MTSGGSRKAAARPSSSLVSSRCGLRSGWRAGGKGRGWVGCVLGTLVSKAQQQLGVVTLWVGAGVGERRLGQMLCGFVCCLCGPAQPRGACVGPGGEGQVDISVEARVC